MLGCFNLAAKITEIALTRLTRSALVSIGVLLYSIRRSLVHVSRIYLSRAMMSLPTLFEVGVIVVLLDLVVLRMVRACISSLLFVLRCATKFSSFLTNRYDFCMYRQSLLNTVFDLFDLQRMLLQ